MAEGIRAPNLPLLNYVDEFLGIQNTGTTKSVGRFSRASVLGGIEAIVSSFQAGGGVIFSTIVQANANRNYDAMTMAWVVLDPVADRNGVYQKVGASGAGSWLRLANLPYSFYRAVNGGAGTANAIIATNGYPLASTEALVVLNIAATNTSSEVTLSLNGAGPLRIKTASGNDPAIGGLISGMLVAGYIDGSYFRLISDQASSAIQTAAEAAQAAAEAARDIATGAMSVFTATAFSTKSVAEAYAPDAAPDYIRLEGHTVAGVGGALYRKVLGEPTHPGKFSITLADAATVVWYEFAEREIDPLQQGAKGDLINDDGPAAANAIAIHQALKIPFVGTRGKSYFLMTWTPIEVTDFDMDGRGAKFVGTGSVNFVHPVGGSFDVVNAKFDTWKMGFQRWNYMWGSGEPDWAGVSDNIGEKTDKITNGLISGCEFSNFNWFVANIGIQLDGFTIKRSKFLDCTGGYVIRLGDNVHNEQDDWTNLRVIRNSFKNTSGSGTASVAPVLLYAVDFEVTGNSIDGVTAVDGDVHAIYVKGIEGVVSKNHIRNVTNAGTAEVSSADITGISIKGAIDQDAEEGVEQQGISVEVFGNEVKNIGSGTTYGTGIKLQTRRSNAFGNTVEVCTYAGIALDNLSGGQDTIARSNVISACDKGVAFSGNGERTSIDDNHIFSCNIGVQLTPQNYLTHTSAAATSCTRNKIKGFTDSVGVQIYAGVDTFDGLDLGGNDIICDTAYLFSDAPGLVSGVRIVGGDISGSTAKFSGTVPSDTHISKLGGYRTRNSFSASIPTGTGGYHVNHGLAGAPVQVNSSPSSDAVAISCTTKDATEVVLVHTAPGTVTAQIEAVMACEYN